jgi:hypothetical protein
MASCDATRRDTTSLEVWKGLVESVTCTPILTGVPFAVVAVPVITPLELRLKPLGNCPLVIFQVRGSTPPADKRVSVYGMPATASDNGPAGVPIVKRATERNVTLVVAI